MRLNVVPVREARFGLKATQWFVIAVTTVIVTIPVPVALINRFVTSTAGLLQ